MWEAKRRAALKTCQSHTQRRGNAQKEDEDTHAREEERCDVN